MNKHRKKIANVRDIIDEIKRNPKVDNTAQFDEEIERVKENVEQLLSDIKDSLGVFSHSFSHKTTPLFSESDDSDLVGRVQELRDELEEARQLVDGVAPKLEAVNTTLSFCLTHSLLCSHSNGR